MNEIIFYALNSLAGYNWLFDKGVNFFANQFPFLLIGALGVFLWMHRDKEGGIKKHSRDLFVVVTAAFAAWLIARAIKYIFPHDRPSVLESTTVLFTADDNSSFPSGHATFFAALPVALYFYHKRIALWYALGALFIGLARIIGGVHWPLDILAGYILGGIIGGGVYFAYKTYFYERQLQNGSKSVE